MTAALHRLLELDEEAAPWTTNPARARTFRAATRMARRVAERQAKAE
jgi:hypothetical protein